MKIQFKIQYTMQWGQSMCLLLHSIDDTVVKYGMHCNEKSEWKLEIQTEAVETITYQYAIQNADKSLSYEYGGVRSIHFPLMKEIVSVIDNWRASYGDSPFVSTAFTDCFFKRTPPKVASTKPTNNLILRIN